MSAISKDVLDQMPFYHPFFIDQTPYLPSRSLKASSSSTLTHSRTSSTSSLASQSTTCSASSSSTSSLTFCEAMQKTSFVPGLPRDHPFNTGTPTSSSPRIDEREQAAWIARVAGSEHLFGSVARRTKQKQVVKETVHVEEQKKRAVKWFRK